MSLRSWIGGGVVKMLEAYEGARYSRSRVETAWVNSKPATEDANIGRYGRSKMRLACTDLLRNDPIISGACKRFADYVVGPEGITPQAKTSDEAWNDAAERWYAERAKIVDYRRRVNHAGLQRQAVIARLYSGDIAFAMLKSGQLQPIEGERIETPQELVSDKQIVDGFKLSASGIPLSCYVHDRAGNGFLDTKHQKIDMADLIYCAAPFRPDSLRPAPELAPLIRIAEDYRDLNRSLLNKARLDAKQAYAVKTEMGADRARQGLGNRNGTPDTADKMVRYETFADNAVHYLNKGESIDGIQGTAPGPYFVEYARHIGRSLGAALGLPYEFLFLDFQQGSFAQSRAALMMTYRTIAIWQTWLRDTFMQRDWNWSISKAILAGDLPQAPIDSRGISEWYKVQWSFPRYDWIDPQSQIAADLDAYKLGVESLQSIVARTSGRDAEDVLRDKGKLISRAKEIAAEVGCDWRDLIDIATNAQRDLSPTEEERGEDGKATNAQGLAKWL